MFVIERIKEMFEGEGIKVGRQKVLLAELGAEFPTVRRQTVKVLVHASIDRKGKVMAISKVVPGKGP